jgi:sialidase-1
MPDKRGLPILLLTFFLVANAFSQPKASFNCQNLFIGGQHHVNQYRIPSLVTSNKGTLIAVCDARVDKPGDPPNNIDLVMRRSFDNGKTWTSQTTLFDYQGDEAAGDASMVVDKQTGIIWLAYDYTVPEPQGNFGRIIRIHLTKSEDDGATWSKPITLNYLTKGKDFWLQNAPGRGLFGRGVVLFPMYTSKNDNSGNQKTVLVYSKDHGKTWLLSNGVGESNSEPQLVELSGGKIMANMRKPHGFGYREVATTKDFGHSWLGLSTDTTLIGPGCQASIINYDFKGKSLLIFSNSANKQGRKNMVVRVSDNEGRSWQKALPVYTGPSAYSCLTQMQNGNVGLLFEADNYSRIVFVEIPSRDL